MLVGVQVFTTVASAMAAISETKNVGERAGQHRISTIIRCLEQRAVSKDLTGNIRDFYNMKYASETPDVSMGTIVSCLCICVAPCGILCILLSRHLPETLVTINS